MTSDPLAAAGLRTVIEPLGYELVELEVGGTAAGRTIRLRIDRLGGSVPGAGVSADDCRRVSRALQEQGVVGEHDALEVSSPGIERPVRFPEHWRRYIGRDVRLKAHGVAGTVTARVEAVPDDAHVTVRIGQDHRTLPLEAVRRATLVVDWSRMATTGKQEKH